MGEEDDRIDLRTLRAIRVLRPLKLVSGVPSKTERDCYVVPGGDEELNSRGYRIRHGIGIEVGTHY